MMGIIEHGRIRSCGKRLSRPRIIISSILFVLLLSYVSLPLDSPIRSALRFQHTVASDYVATHLASDAWLYSTQRFPIDPANDIGIVLKTGYGTKQRIPLNIRALGNESFDADMLVIQDYPPLASDVYTQPNGKVVPQVDIIGWMLESGVLKGHERTERMGKYKRIVEAIEAEEWQLAEGLSKDVGWELDALKFIPGLKYAWDTMPKKKWYVMLDDDTYLIKSSLTLLLGHLDWRKPRYIGNPVGDFKGRFAHGGSAVVLSGAALKKLYDDHPKVVNSAYFEAPTATWGDKILSTTLMKVGVYLDETYSRMFNGENPFMTRLWTNRFCMPLISFHGLGEAHMMNLTGTTFADMKEPVYWSQLGRIFRSSSWESFELEPIRKDINFVGRLDEHSTTTRNVSKAEDCLAQCTDAGSKCLAWTWDSGRKECYTAPWAIVGDRAEALFSGVNSKVAVKLQRQCHSPR